MKATLRALIALLLFNLAGYNAQAQTTVTINPGYTNQTFYKMSSGTVSSVSNTDWDLGFQLRGFAASILINSKNGVQAYRANKDASQWGSMVASDTTGYINNPAYQLLNSDTSWDFGALNTTNDPNNAFDLGWGTYDFTTHAVVGDSVFFLRLKSGANYVWKKFMIESLAGGIYSFKWADVDGSNPQTATLNKTTYAGKFFVYYSLINNVAIDREPMYNAWDLSFAQYMSIIPQPVPTPYMVTGVLANDSVFVAKAYPVDTATNAYGSLAFHPEINTIGYDWKSFNMSTFTYDIADSTIYYVQDRQGVVWKMIFTGFDGSTTGNFYFNQQLATAVGLVENAAIKTFDLYPNPATGQTRLVLSVEKTEPAVVQIIDMNGKIVDNHNIELQAGLQLLDLSLEKCNSGLYQVVIIAEQGTQTARLIVQ